MIIKVKNETFAYDVIWFVWEKEEFVEYMVKQNIEVDYNMLNHWFSYIDNCIGYIYLDDKSDYVLIHEIIHIVQWILNNKMIDTWYANTEVLAYNVDWLYRKLLYHYYKKKSDDRFKNYQN